MIKQTMSVHRSTRRRRGIALVLVMIAVAVAMTLSLSFIVAQSTSHGIAQNVQDHAQARHLAESGLAMTIAHVQNTSGWRSVHPNGQWVTDEAYAGGTFTISGEDGQDTDGDGLISPGTEGDGSLSDDDADPVTITAVGVFNNVSHTVQAVYAPGGSSAPNAYVTAGVRIELNSESEIDAFDSRNGPYSGSNNSWDAVVQINSTSNNAVRLNSESLIKGDGYSGPGSDPDDVFDPPSDVTGSLDVLDEEIPMPTVTAPTDTGSNQGDKKYDGGTHTISSNQHFDKLEIDSQATVRIDGDVTIYVEDEFMVNSESEIELMADATLKLYVAGKFELNSESLVNTNTGDPRQVFVYLMGSDDAKVNSESLLVAQVIAPDRDFQVNSESHVYGTFIGKRLFLNSESEFHMDTNPEVGLAGESEGGGGSGPALVRWVERP